jgi:hypothetical protein
MTITNGEAEPFQMSIGEEKTRCEAMDSPNVYPLKPSRVNVETKNEWLCVDISENHAQKTAVIKTRAKPGQS